MSLFDFIKEVAYNKYYYWRFRFYANKLDRERRKEEKRRYGSDFARFIIKLLPKE